MNTQIQGEALQVESSQSLHSDKPKGDVVIFLRRSARLLMAVSIGLLGFMVYHLFFIKDIRSIDGILAETERHNGKVALEEIALPAKKSYDVYEQTIKERLLFEAVYSTEPARVTAGADASDVNLARDYKVVGIILDKKLPQAVIEDIQHKETLFITIGDTLGNARLEEVTAERLIFDQNEQKVELLP